MLIRIEEYLTIKMVYMNQTLSATLRLMHTSFVSIWKSFHNILTWRDDRNVHGAWIDSSWEPLHPSDVLVHELEIHLCITEVTLIESNAFALHILSNNWTQVAG